MAARSPTCTTPCTITRSCSTIQPDCRRTELGWCGTRSAPSRLENTTVVAADISALLVITDDGAILLDGGLPQAADMLLSHMQSLGVAPHDLGLLLASHAHGDHVGPTAAIELAIGATVAHSTD